MRTHVGPELQPRSTATTQSILAPRALRSLPVLFVLAAAAGACHSMEQEPIQLERNQLTVDNRSSQDWSNVEIAVNYYYKIRAPKIASGSRFTATLDTFAAGFGQRFDWRKAQIRDLTLTATLPDGKPFELKKDFSQQGLAKILGGSVKGGKR
jgi:hypothetical protein